MRPCEEERQGEPGHQEAMRVKSGQKGQVIKMAALYRGGYLGEGGLGFRSLG